MFDFSFDSPVMEFMGKIVDIFVLCFIWFVMCLPIITIGASTTSAYYVMFNQLNQKDGYVFRRFFESFKENFKQSTVVFIIILSIVGFSVLNLFIINESGMDVPIIVKNIMLGTQIFVLYQVLVLFIYSFSLLSKISFKTKYLIVTSLQLGNKHLKTTLLILIIIASLPLMVFVAPVLIFVIAPIYFVLSAKLLKSVIKKYRPEVFYTELDDEVVKELYKQKKI